MSVQAVPADVKHAQLPAIRMPVPPVPAEECPKTTMVTTQAKENAVKKYHQKRAFLQKGSLFVITIAKNKGNPQPLFFILLSGHRANPATGTIYVYCPFQSSCRTKNAARPPAQ